MLSKAATTFVALKDVLRHKPLVTLSLGAFFTSLVGGIVNLLLTIHVYDISGSSPLAVSALFLVTFMPNLIVAPLFSGIADKYHRRIVLAVGGTLRALCCLLLAFNHNIALSFILAFVITSIAAVMKPARYAKAAELVSDSKLSVLNSVLSFMINAAGIASGALAGLLTNFNSVAAFAVAAFGSLIAASLDGCYSHEEHNSKRAVDSHNGFRESHSISFWVKLKGIISSTTIRLKHSIKKCFRPYQKGTTSCCPVHCCSCTLVRPRTTRNSTRCFHPYGVTCSKLCLRVFEHDWIHWGTYRSSTSCTFFLKYPISNKKFANVPHRFWNSLLRVCIERSISDFRFLQLFCIFFILYNCQCN